MNEKTIAEAIILILPVLAFLVSYALQQAHFTPNTNSIISIATILLAAIASSLFQGKLTGNTLTDVGAVLVAATTLQVETFAPLQEYLRTNFLNTKKETQD